tara:strand:- start:354 stop:635 length:282 start_codon:yes stop_codon:yes gene_type:complete
MKVLVYSKEHCPYCVQAKQLLTQKKVQFEEVHVDQDPKKLGEMLAKSNGQRTVPQIFIGDHHVGGFTDLRELDQQGRLDELLKSLDELLKKGE